jgi:predicted ATPase
MPTKTSSKPLHAMEPIFKSVTLRNFLSFSPNSAALPLTALNVFIGPNGSGKSNLIEAFELLRASPTDLAAPIREGGSVSEWLWKGDSASVKSELEASISFVLRGKGVLDNQALALGASDLNHRLSFAQSGHRLEILDEAIEEDSPRKSNKTDVFFYYRFQRGNPVMNIRKVGGSGTSQAFTQRKLQRESLTPDQSVLSQRKDPDLYPEITRLGKIYGEIQTFREWSFGRSVPPRKAQPADLPAYPLMPDSRNLGMALNELEHRSSTWQQLNDYCRRFLPRFGHLTTRVQSNQVQIYLHETGLNSPVPATRLSDGTIRFFALLAILLNPDPPPLICMEEPELGLHPDALALLAELLVAASTRTQLIVTTHSDVLISALTNHLESVVVTEMLGNGTEFHRLESTKLQHWLKEYRLGEIWRIGKLGGNLW